MASLTQDWKDRVKRQKREDDRSLRRSTLGFIALFALATGSLTCATLAVQSWASANTRALCDDVMARLMRAETMVELEREKFLIGSVRCSVERRLRELRPAQR